MSTRKRQGLNVEVDWVRLNGRPKLHLEGFPHYSHLTSPTFQRRDSYLNRFETIKVFHFWVSPMPKWCPFGIEFRLFDRFFVQRLIAIVCRRPLNLSSISLPISPGEICPILMISSEDSFPYSTKLLLSFLVKISTRYPYFRDSAETGKRCSILGCLSPKWIRWTRPKEYRALAGTK